VTLNADGFLTCSCEASQYGRLCRHRISVIHDHLQELIMPFNPADHIENIERDSRKPARMYLPVRWRLVWLREVAPEAVITTTLLERTDTFALFRAQVTLPDGGASATGHGSEYREAMKRYGFADEDDRLAIAEDIGRGPFDHLTANQLKGIVDAAKATLVVKGEDGHWAIAEPVLEHSTNAAELATATR
jgi:hypothetical protein